MNNRIPKKLKQSIGLGAIAGIRSMSAPALLSNYMKNHRSKRLRRTKLNFMQSDKAANIFKILAAAEMVGDILPTTPNRTKPGSLLGRGLSGALVGATLSRSQRKKRFAGAGIGLLSALTATYISFYLRKTLTKNTFMPGTFWGVAEDILAIRSGQKLLRQ